jgi:hypothetical protein
MPVQGVVKCLNPRRGQAPGATAFGSEGTTLATVKEPVTAVEMAKRFARAKPRDVGEILETLCTMRKSRHGPPTAKAATRQAKAGGKFLPRPFPWEGERTRELKPLRMF